MIQPYGLLLGFDRELARVTASANLPEALQGVSVGALGPGLAAAVATILADPRAEPTPAVVTIGGHAWHAWVHASTDVVFVELEPFAEDDHDRVQIGWLVDRACERLRAATDVDAMLEMATHAIRHICGFERVVVQRVRHFDAAPDLVVDAHAHAVPLVPAAHPRTGTPFDLDRCALRFPAEDDVLYLGRVGVTASLTIPVVCDERPWAIVSCQHPTTRWVSRAIRAACRVVAQTLGFVIERIDARALEKQRNLFIGIVGHDLRSPLNAISLAAELVSGDPVLDRTTLARVGDRLRSATHRMRHMVDQLLDYSRVQAGLGLGIQTAPVDLHALARTIVAESGTAGPAADISLRLSGPHEAEVDGDRIGQLLANLLSNARDHGVPSSPIDVEIAGDDRRVTIHVRNAGPAIPPELLPRLFDPYKPQSLRKQGNRGGLGLGLHIVKQIVEGHRGTIDVASANDETRVVVELPRTRESPQ